MRILAASICVVSTEFFLIFFLKRLKLLRLCGIGIGIPEY